MERLSSRWASATKMVCQLELTVETQPPTPSGFAGMSAMISQFFTILLLTIQHRLRCGFAHFEPCADFLNLRCLLFQVSARASISFCFPAAVIFPVPVPRALKYGRSCLHPL